MLAYFACVIRASQRKPVNFSSSACHYTYYTLSHRLSLRINSPAAIFARLPFSTSRAANKNKTGKHAKQVVLQNVNSDSSASLTYLISQIIPFRLQAREPIFPVHFANPQ